MIQNTKKRKSASDSAAGGNDDAQAGGTRHDRLAQLRLLIALDALLRERSVSRAAAELGLQTSAMSRLLGQLREIYGDPLFQRTGKGLVPTPLAESLRMRVRALASETERLMDTSKPARRTPAGTPGPTGWEEPALMEAPPLATLPAMLLEGQPGPWDIARNLAQIGDNAEPSQRLAKYIATSSAGANRSRPLTSEEARDALSIILEGNADPVQIGAFLTTMQYRGPTPGELAGFVTAARNHIAAMTPGRGVADLDWPAYISPRMRSAPWFIHAVRLVAMAGYRVVLHGHSGGGERAGKLQVAARSAGIPVCRSLAQIAGALQETSMAYVPLVAMGPQLSRLLGLYPLLEMRLPLNAIMPLLNPAGAPVSLLGALQFQRHDMHREVALLLEGQDLSIIGNVRDFAQYSPFRQTTVFRLQDGQTSDLILPALPEPQAEPETPMTSREYWEALWSGAARDERLETTIISTAALALMTLERTDETGFNAAFARASALWHNRLV